MRGLPPKLNKKREWPGTDVIMDYIEKGASGQDILDIYKSNYVQRTQLTVKIVTELRLKISAHISSNKRHIMYHAPANRIKVYTEVVKIVGSTQLQERDWWYISQGSERPRSTLEAIQFYANMAKAGVQDLLPGKVAAGTNWQYWPPRMVNVIARDIDLQFDKDYPNPDSAGSIAAIKAIGEHLKPWFEPAIYGPFKTGSKSIGQSGGLIMGMITGKKDFLIDALNAGRYIKTVDGKYYLDNLEAIKKRAYGFPSFEIAIAKAYLDLEEISEEAQIHADLIAPNITLKQAHWATDWATDINFFSSIDLKGFADDLDRMELGRLIERFRTLGKQNLVGSGIDILDAFGQAIVRKVNSGKDIYTNFKQAKFWEPSDQNSWNDSGKNKVGTSYTGQNKTVVVSMVKGILDSWKRQELPFWEEDRGKNTAAYWRDAEKVVLGKSDDAWWANYMYNAYKTLLGISDESTIRQAQDFLEMKHYDAEKFGFTDKQIEELASIILANAIAGKNEKFVQYSWGADAPYSVFGPMLPYSKQSTTNKKLMDKLIEMGKLRGSNAMMHHLDLPYFMELDKKGIEDLARIWWDNSPNRSTLPADWDPDPKKAIPVPYEAIHKMMAGFAGTTYIGEAEKTKIIDRFLKLFKDKIDTPALYNLVKTAPYDSRHASITNFNSLALSDNISEGQFKAILNAPKTVLSRADFAADVMTKLKPVEDEDGEDIPMTERQMKLIEHLFEKMDDPAHINKLRREYQEFMTEGQITWMKMVGSNRNRAEKLYLKASKSMRKRLAGAYLNNQEFASTAAAALTAPASPIKPYTTLDKKRVRDILKYNNVVSEDSKLSDKILHNFNTMDMHVRKSGVKKPLEDLQITENDLKPDELNALTANLHTTRRSNNHGRNGLKILRSFNVNIPLQEKSQTDWINANPNQEIINPMFHGTGSIAASMILRYGFRVISAGDSSITGRMLGNGVYGAIHMDKSQQYVGDNGYGRSVGTKGYIFVCNAALGQKGKDYRASGVGGSGYQTQSPEWCVFTPNSQFKIVKAYEVELVEETTINSIVADVRRKGKGVNEGKLKNFRKFLGEEIKKETMKNVTNYIFINGYIPVNEHDTVDFEDFTPPNTNVSLEPSAYGPSVVVTGTKESATHIFTSAADFRQNHPKEFEEYVTHLKED